jgi:hypothetical protein
MIPYKEGEFDNNYRMSLLRLGYQENMVSRLGDFSYSLSYLLCDKTPAIL